MRIEQLTFTRFIAALAIVIFHFGRDIFPFDAELIRPVIAASNTGVSYFFILSGFVITIAYFHHPAIKSADFYLFRISRIFPAFLLSVILTLFYFLLTGIEIDVLNLVLQLLLLHAWIKEYCLTLNFPSWSLSVEIMFYALYPFLFNYLYRRQSKRTLYVVMFLFWISAQAIYLFIQQSGNIHTDWKHFSFYFPPFHLNEFLAGNMLALYLFTNIGRLKSKNSAAVLLVFIVLLVLLSIPSMKNYYHNGLLVPVFCLLIYLLSVNNGWLATLFRKKLFVLSGEISYGLYIYQYPVFKLSSFFLIKVLKFNHSIAVFYINLCILLLISYLSYRFIEHPAVRRTKQYVQKHASGQLKQ
jgi:peptidoglycan/LPS O-acetylase OafA/YrhL